MKMFSMAAHFENEKKIQAAQRKARMKEFEKSRKTMSTDQRNASQTRQSTGGRVLKSSASESDLVRKMQKNNQPQEPISSQPSLPQKQDEITELKPTEDDSAKEK